MNAAVSILFTTANPPYTLEALALVIELVIFLMHIMTKLSIFIVVTYNLEPIVSSMIYFTNKVSL